MSRRYSTQSLGGLPRYYRPRVAKPDQIYDELPKKNLMCLGAVCFATLIASENAYLDFSTTFFTFYSHADRKSGSEMRKGDRINTPCKLIPSTPL